MWNLYFIYVYIKLYEILEVELKDVVREDNIIWFECLILNWGK